MNADKTNMLLFVINMDPYTVHEAHLRIPIEDCGIGEQDTYQMHELIQDYHHQIVGQDYTIRLDPNQEPAAIFAIRRWIRRESDFDYFM